MAGPDWSGEATFGVDRFLVRWFARPYWPLYILRPLGSRGLGPGAFGLGPGALGHKPGATGHSPGAYEPGLELPDRTGSSRTRPRGPRTRPGGSPWLQLLCKASQSCNSNQGSGPRRKLHFTVNYPGFRSLPQLSAPTRIFDFRQASGQIWAWDPAYRLGLKNTPQSGKTNSGYSF